MSMQVLIGKNPQAVGEMAATILAGQMLKKSDSVLGLATGSSPIPTYQALVRMHGAGAWDATRMRSFNLDEYVGLTADHPQSYHAFMWENLFTPLGLRPEQVRLPSGVAPDLNAECAAYDAAIEAAGGIDLQVLGIGLNGHIGFNEPEAVFSKGTHVVALTPSTIEANRRFFGPGESVPTCAVTAGVRTILQARRIILIACGEEKADIIRATVEGEITPAVPASILQVHADVRILVDAAAASKLRA